MTMYHYTRWRDIVVLATSKTIRTCADFAVGAERFAPEIGGPAKCRSGTSEKLVPG